MTMKAALADVCDSYETLYPICSATANNLIRFHNHLDRIYSPTIRSLEKLPTMLTDGTYLRISKEIYDRAVSGDGLTLGKRLASSGYDMARRIWSKATNGSGERSGDSGSGSPGTS